jgi:flagellar motility protein MotE (MotC chaperone)
MKRIEKIFLLILGLFFLKALLLAFYAGAEMSGSSIPQNATMRESNCLEELRTSLLQEKEALEAEKRDLLAKKEELLLLEKRVQEQMAALKELINNAEVKLQELKGIQDERFKLLVKSYSEMRPSKAAQMLINMDRETAVKILSQLKSSQVANILAAMPPDKAAALVEAMTGSPAKE